MNKPEENIPLEERAYVLVIYNPEFIADLEDIPIGTNRVYYKGSAFKVPPYRSVEDVVMEIAEGCFNPEVLDCKRIHQFTTRIDDALDFPHDDPDIDVHSVAMSLESELGIKILIQHLNRRWYPF